MSQPQIDEVIIKMIDVMKYANLLLINNAKMTTKDSKWSWYSAASHQVWRAHWNVNGNHWLKTDGQLIGYNLPFHYNNFEYTIN